MEFRNNHNVLVVHSSGKIDVTTTASAGVKFDKDCILCLNPAEDMFVKIGSASTTIATTDGTSHKIFGGHPNYVAVPDGWYISAILPSGSDTLYYSEMR
jgi:hypothetical protein